MCTCLSSAHTPMLLPAEPKAMLLKLSFCLANMAVCGFVLLPYNLMLPSARLEVSPSGTGIGKCIVVHLLHSYWCHRRGLSFLRPVVPPLSPRWILEAFCGIPEHLKLSLSIRLKKKKEEEKRNFTGEGNFVYLKYLLAVFVPWRLQGGLQYK